MTTRQRNTTATSQGNNSETEEIGPATTARAAPPDDEIDRLLSWAEGLFGQGHAGLISVAHTQISRKFMPSPQAALISRSIARQARNCFTTSRYGRLSRFCKIGAVTVAKTIRSSASALTTVSGRDRSAR